jgi:hypothetical protein
MNYFKAGVSDWILKFESDTVEIKTVSEEVVSYMADGKIKIVVSDVTFKKELLELFRKGNLVKQIIQSFWLFDNTGTKIADATYEYNNLVITDISYQAALDAFTDCNITFKSE